MGFLFSYWKLLAAGAVVLMIGAGALYVRGMQSTIREQATLIGALEVAKAVQDKTIEEQSAALVAFEEADKRRLGFLDGQRNQRIEDDAEIRRLGRREPTVEGATAGNAAIADRNRRLRCITGSIECVSDVD